jgi:hypothetical protein
MSRRTPTTPSQALPAEEYELPTINDEPEAGPSRPRRTKPLAPVRRLTIHAGPSSSVLFSAHPSYSPNQAIMDMDMDIIVIPLIPNHLEHLISWMRILIISVGPKLGEVRKFRCLILDICWGLIRMMRIIMLLLLVWGVCGRRGCIC